METRSPASKTTTEGTGTFVPIPGMDKMSVGHAGLYPTDDAIDVETAQVVSADIPLGIKGGKTLIDCEKGIKAFVKDELAGDKGNGLPNTETGVWVHYLTQGIMRDYGRTWENPPVSIKEKASLAEKARTTGKRVLSKKEKNELIARRSYEYWEQDILYGKITEEEADMFMKEARDKVRELQDAGFFVSTKKTEGVALFDWKSAVIGAHGREDATKVYTKNKVEVIIPDLVNNFYLSTSQPKKLAKELSKTPLAFTEGVANQVYKGTGENKYGGAELKKIKTEGDLYKLLKEDSKYSNTINKIDKEFNIKGVHLTKINSSGMMKPRQICIDCVSRRDSTQHLFLLDAEGGTLHLQ
jgi:hypothetical protein